MKKVIITILSGCASLTEKPDDIEVEIRDYDVEWDWDEDNESCKVDSDGDRYQEIIFSAEKENFPDEVKINYRNSYKHCDYEWSDEWDSTCNDRCPVCNKEIEPYLSEKI